MSTLQPVIITFHAQVCSNENIHTGEVKLEFGAKTKLRYLAA